MGALGVVLPLLPAQGGWRNGRRARFRSVCPKGREGSNPSSPTRRFMLAVGRWPASRWSAVLSRGRPPGNPPRGTLSGSGSRRWPCATGWGARRWPYAAVDLVAPASLWCGARRWPGSGLFWCSPSAGCSGARPRVCRPLRCSRVTCSPLGGGGIPDSWKVRGVVRGPWCAGCRIGGRALLVVGRSPSVALFMRASGAIVVRESAKVSYIPVS
jgi:hypothetical protein